MKRIFAENNSPRHLILLLVATSIIALSVAGAHGADVNLQLISMEGPSNVLTGKPLGDVLSATVRNTGSESITEPFYIGFYISADTIITASDEPLAGDPDGITSLI